MFYVKCILHIILFTQSWLSDLFSWMYFGDGIIAIIAGLIASGAANPGSGEENPTGPFDVSAFVLFDEFLPLFEQVVDARTYGCGVRFLADVLMVKLIYYISELLKA